MAMVQCIDITSIHVSPCSCNHAGVTVHSYITAAVRSPCKYTSVAMGCGGGGVGKRSTLVLIDDVHLLHTSIPTYVHSYVHLLIAVTYAL